VDACAGFDVLGKELGEDDLLGEEFGADGDLGLPRTVAAGEREQVKEVEDEQDVEERPAHGDQ
jgi:hypothetical protein